MNKLPENFKLDRYGLHCRLVNEDDAEFITMLRSDSKLGRFIHASEGDVAKQKEWISEYKKREKEGLDYYFIFSKEDIPLGVCRIYDILENSFASGSWIFTPDAPKGASVLGDIITREIAFELYPNSVNLFDVRKQNTNVNRYTRSFCPKIISEDGLNFYYSQSKENFEKYKVKFIRMLT